MPQAVADAPKGSGINEAYVCLQAIRMHLALGENGPAMDMIEDLLTRQSFQTRGYLKVDPMFAPLRNNERFKQFISGGITRPTGRTPVVERPVCVLNQAIAVVLLQVPNRAGDSRAHSLAFARIRDAGQRRSGHERD